VNILTLLEMAADATPDQVAVGSLADGITYSHLHRLALDAATMFRRGSAERVVLCAESSPAVVVAMFGAAAAGLPYVPLNYRLHDTKLRQLLRRCSPGVLLADQSTIRRLGDVPDMEVTPVDSLLGPCPVPAHLALAPAVDPDPIAVLLFTSGTTGEPKSAVLRHRHLSSYILGSVEFGGAEPDEATLVSVPTYHIAGVASALSSIWSGRRIVHLTSFDAHDWIDAIEREAITHAMVVPTMLTRIVEALDQRGGEPNVSMRTLSYGGGRMPSRVIQRALELFPITSFVNAYGLTETSSTICLLGPDDHRLAQYSDIPSEQARLTSVGLPLPGIELEIRSSDGTVNEPGTAGEIHVRGEQISGEYLEKGSLLDDDGWFPTKDNGYIDGSGYLYVLGRNDDVIVRGGENLSPGEIEDVLLSHPCVEDAAVFGVPSLEWGECVAAAIAPVGAPPDRDELRDLVGSRLRTSRIPTHVMFLDELPYNDTGKLIRRDLRTRFAHLGNDTD